MKRMILLPILASIPLAAQGFKAADISRLQSDTKRFAKVSHRLDVLVDNLIVCFSNPDYSQSEDCQENAANLRDLYSEWHAALVAVLTDESGMYEYADKNHVSAEKKQLFDNIAADNLKIVETMNAKLETLRTKAEAPIWIPDPINTLS